MDEEKISFTIRVPQYLLDDLDKEAGREGRTRNSHLVQIIKERFGYLDKDAEANAA